LLSRLTVIPPRPVAGRQLQRAIRREIGPFSIHAHTCALWAGAVVRVAPALMRLPLGITRSKTCRRFCARVNLTEQVSQLPRESGILGRSDKSGQSQPSSATHGATSFHCFTWQPARWSFWAAKVVPFFFAIDNGGHVDIKFGGFIGGRHGPGTPNLKDKRLEFGIEFNY
jgi:hypothetical protein